MYKLFEAAYLSVREFIEDNREAMEFACAYDDELCRLCDCGEEGAGFFDRYSKLLEEMLDQAEHEPRRV